MNVPFRSNTRTVLGRTLYGSQMTRMTLELASPLQTFSPQHREDAWPATSYLTCTRTRYMVDLQWNQVSSLEPSSPDLTSRPQRPLKTLVVKLSALV
ncbi:hypothetical protein AVEN_91840-1 [Araneus ventricosus]|uniref:Uncharacterized protein n=1 Tax=Araneus ventricosus TaxID=182803 RepID=A0A4Y2G7G7_ARAVE|nr:hypothetical protein AVEN_91840-1 [Araneus ventricosus]